MRIPEMRSETNSFYLSAALAVIGAALIGLWLFTPDASQPGDWKAATGKTTQNATTQTAAVDGSAFRYGPEINHGASDTPVNAREQALKEARGMAPDQSRASGRSQRSGTTTFFNRGMQSGH